MTIGFDTMLAAHLLDENRPRSLLEHASTALGVDNWGKGITRFGTAEVDDLRSLLTIPTKSGLTSLFGTGGISYYGSRDAAYTHLLYEQQRERLREDRLSGRLLSKLVLPGINAYVEMELNGICVDQDRVHEHDRILAQRCSEIREVLIDEYIDPDLWAEWEEKSAKSKVKKDTLANDHFLRDWLFSARPRGLGLVPTSFTAVTKAPQVSEDVLLSFDHPALKMLNRLKHANKARSFFTQWREWMGDDGRIHAFFNLAGTVTGRRSSANPNLQQVPRPATEPLVRPCLGAPPGWLLLEVDYSQLEVRIAAWLADEDRMLDAYARGFDIYSFTVASFLQKDISEVTKEERRRGKAYVLGFIYGMGATGFVRYAKENYDLDITQDEAEATRTAFFALYPKLVYWHERQRRDARRRLEVSSLVGRKRHLVDVLSQSGRERAKAERQAINSPDQGLGADLTLAAVIELQGKLDREEVRLVGDIHDAILFEVREDRWRENARTILSVMEKPRLIVDLIGEADWPVRLVAEGQIGRHWSEGPEFTLDTLDGLTL